MKTGKTSRTEKSVNLSCAAVTILCALAALSLYGCDSGGGGGGGGGVTPPPPAQPFRTFGGPEDDEAFCVQQTVDGGYVLAGQTFSYGPGNCDMYLVKADADGNEVWYNTFGGRDGDGAWSVLQAPDRGYVLAGFTGSFGARKYDMYLVRTDGSGNEVWSNRFGGAENEIAYCVRPTSDGGYVLAGYTESYPVGESRAYLVKTDADGNEMWSRAYGAADTDTRAYCVEQTSDEGYIVAGFSDLGDWGPSPAICLIKTDADGNEMWSTTFDDAAWGEARSVQQTPDGGYILTGSTLPCSDCRFDIRIVKADPEGYEEWSNTIGGTTDDFAYSLQRTLDGEYVLAGYTWTSREADMYLVKVDPEGDGCVLWERKYGGMDSEAAYCVEQTWDGGYILAGSTDSFGAGGYDMCLLKTDNEGWAEWE